MVEIDKAYKLKKFFMNLYREGLKEGNNLSDGEFIRVVRITDSKSVQEKYFKNIDDLIKYALSKDSFFYNTYFELVTTNDEGGKTENLKHAYCLALDFDKSEFDRKLTIGELVEKFKSIGLFYHAIVDSGNGFHVYIYIQKTNCFNLIKEVATQISNKIGADLKSCNFTQLLRIPYTYNIKNTNEKKSVNIVHSIEKNNIKRYNIKKLYKNYCKHDEEISGNEKNKSNKSPQSIVKANIKPCVINILENGSKEHCNNSDLQKIVVELRSKNKTVDEIEYNCNRWNSLNAMPWNQTELDYQIKYMYNSLIRTQYNCKDCIYQSTCKDMRISDFEFNDESILISVSETQMKSLRKPNRKGVKVMEGNDLVIYGVLKNHNDGLYREELIRELTYKKKCKLSDVTLTKVLKNLELNGFIEVKEGKKKFYYIPKARHKAELTFQIRFSATYECIKGSITSDELRLYCYMRYLHHKEQRENPKALKGNLYHINQRELAKLYGTTQQRISQMIINLENEKIISIYYREKSKNNGYEYYTYRLNY